MRRVVDAAYLAAGGLAAACIVAICLLMVGQSIAREVGQPTGGVNDIVAWLCAAAAFLGLAHAFKHGDFVRVTLSLDRVPQRWRQPLEAASLAVAALAVGYLAWWATRFTAESHEFREMSSGLIVLPLWIPQSSFVAGSWILFVAVVDELIIVLRGRTPTYQLAVEERRARGDYSGDI